MPFVVSSGSGAPAGLETVMRPLEPTRLQAALLRWRGPWAVTGWLLIVLATAGVVGWLLGIRVLVQPFLSRPPLRPAAAVGLLALGIASLGMDGGRRRVALIGAAVAIGLGAFELIHLATGLDTGLDRAVLLFQPRPGLDRKSTRLNSSHSVTSRMPSSA